MGGKKNLKKKLKIQKTNEEKKTQWSTTIDHRLWSPRGLLLLLLMLLLLLLLQQMKREMQELRFRN